MKLILWLGLLVFPSHVFAITLDANAALGFAGVADAVLGSSDVARVVGIAGKGCIQIGANN